MEKRDTLVVTNNEFSNRKNRYFYSIFHNSYLDSSNEVRMRTTDEHFYKSAKIADTSLSKKLSKKSASGKSRVYKLQNSLGSDTYIIDARESSVSSNEDERTHTIQHGPTNIKRMSQQPELASKILHLTDELKHTFTGGSKDSKIDSGTMTNILLPSGKIPASKLSNVTFYLSKDGSSKQVDESFDVSKMLSFNGNFPQLIQGENSEFSKETFYGFDQL